MEPKATRTWVKSVKRKGGLYSGKEVEEGAVGERGRRGRKGGIGERIRSSRGKGRKRGRRAGGREKREEDMEEWGEGLHALL